MQSKQLKHLETSKMEKIRIFLLFLITTISQISEIRADSPLTSTDFYTAYLDIPVVKSAANKRGVLSIDAKVFLYDSKNPLDQKLALINAVGWNFNGLTSYQEYLYFCKDKFRTENKLSSGQIISDLEIVAALPPEQMVVLAYLSALSDYFDMSVPWMFSRLALSDKENSQSYMLPIALVLAQMYLDSDEWCNVYKVMQDLFVNVTNKDMRPQAVIQIMNYIDGYKEYCN